MTCDTKRPADVQITLTNFLFRSADIILAGGAHNFARARSQLNARCFLNARLPLADEFFRIICSYFWRSSNIYLFGPDLLKHIIYVVTIQTTRSNSRHNSVRNNINFTRIWSLKNALWAESCPWIVVCPCQVWTIPSVDWHPRNYQLIPQMRCRRNKQVKNTKGVWGSTSLSETKVSVRWCHSGFKEESLKRCAIGLLI